MKKWIKLDKIKGENAKDIDIEAIKKAITPKKGIDYFDGEDGITTIIKQFKDLSPEELVEKLESLKDDNRLDAKAIKNLDNYISTVYLGGGANTFTGLTDTPDSYSGQSGKFPRVNSTEDGLEFVSGASSGVTSVDGQTGDVDLSGSYQPLEDQRLSTTNSVEFQNVTTDYTQFNTDYLDGHAEGRLQWNAEDGTLEVGLGGNIVNLQIGQEIIVKVSNGEVTPITNGTVVTFVGSQGSRPKAYRCIAGDPTYGHPCGVATEDITSNGYVTTEGLVRDFDTSGLSVGIVYVNGTGGYTNTRPTPPNEPYCVGLCLVSGVGNGLIYVNPQNQKLYSELDNRYASISHISDLDNPHDTSDANLITSDITTNNATTLKHGFLPKLSGVATQYLNGQGSYATISGSTVPAGYSEVSFTGQTSVNVVHDFGIKPIIQIYDTNGDVFIAYNIRHNTDNDFTVTFDVATSGTIISSVAREVPNIVTVSADYDILTNDNIVVSTARNITITLPTAIGKQGKLYTIDNSSTGDIFVDTTLSQTIQGELVQTVPSQSSMVVYSNSSNWRIT